MKMMMKMMKATKTIGLKIIEKIQLKSFHAMLKSPAANLRINRVIMMRTIRIIANDSIIQSLNFLPYGVFNVYFISTFPIMKCYILLHNRVEPISLLSDILYNAALHKAICISFSNISLDQMPKK